MTDLNKACARLPIPFVVLFLCLAAVSCSQRKDAAAPGRNRAPVPVGTAQAVSGDLPVEISSVGTVEPLFLVTVRPQVTGKIQAVHFTEGQEVKAGDPLVTLDASAWNAALNQAVANLRRAEAQLLNARLEFLRTSNLFKSNIASEQDFQTAEATFLAAQSIVNADAAAVTNAMVSLSYTEIRAPIDGRTGALQVKAGNVIKAPDDAIVTIASLKPAQVVFGVPEHHLNAIRSRAANASLEVRAFAPGETERQSIGELTFINNRVSPGTGTIQLKARFDNEDLTLWPGQFVNTVLTLSNLVNVTSIPSHAVQSGQNGEYVFVVTADGAAEMRPVKPGITHAGKTAILQGVAAGETVISEGHLRVTPGAKVVIKNNPMSAASVTPAVAAP
ncbi:MAG TPA: efflux RND transporter periplasmic adaptor subunit [Verrucomicrobiae bacterium]|nr:efflux RND transporter periplasmic adaptor subunit [Verrucomicrobiae bacterium]